MPFTFDDQHIVLRIQGGFGGGVDAENEGALLVARASAISAGDGLQFTDDGDQTVTLEIMGSIEVVNEAGTQLDVDIASPIRSTGLGVNGVAITNAEGLDGGDKPLLVDTEGTFTGSTGGTETGQAGDVLTVVAPTTDQAARVKSVSISASNGGGAGSTITFRLELTSGGTASAIAIVTETVSAGGTVDIDSSQLLGSRTLLVTDDETLRVTSTTDADVTVNTNAVYENLSAYPKYQ